MAQKTISILGCGWLGFPLAQALVKQGYLVKGSTTTPAKLELLQQNGILPFLISFPGKSLKTELRSFLDSDVVILNLPPKRSIPESSDYENTIQQIVAELPNPSIKILFVSSTSVYPDLNREVFEQDALASQKSENLLLRCENQILHAKGQQATILRFGGLMGGIRHPGKFLAGRQNVQQPDAPVNMIHLLDCIGLIQEIVAQTKWGYTFNACAPSHPSRKEFYTAATAQLGLTPPQFLEEELDSYKIIYSNFIQQELNYTYTFPDLLACLASPHF